VPRLSPTVPKRLLADRRPPAEVMPEGDVRVEALSNAVVAYDRREDFAREISALWTRAQTTFLRIGQYLNLAKERLPHGVRIPTMSAIDSDRNQPSVPIEASRAFR
jgi:hypothetical protein